MAPTDESPAALEIKSVSQGEHESVVKNYCTTREGIPGSSISKESACSVGDPGLILGSGRSPGEGNGSPLQYSCLGNPMDRGAWWATIHGVMKESDTREQLNTHI